MSPVYVSCIPLDEGLEDLMTWGERATDELVLARLWLEQIDWNPSAPREPRAAYLRSGDKESRFGTIGHALDAWRGGPDSVLGIPAGAGEHVVELIQAAAEYAASRGVSSPWLLTAATPNVAPTTSLAGDPTARLIANGRLIEIDPNPAEELDRPAVVATPVPTSLPIAVLRIDETPEAITGVARFLDGVDREAAQAVYRQAADAGDRDARRPLADGRQPRPVAETPALARQQR